MDRRPHPHLLVWQWNSRGNGRKRAVLQTFLDNGDRPEIIAIQECIVLTGM